MKLTDQHVTDEEINILIDEAERNELTEFYGVVLLRALLELKQRRAEDRLKNSLDS